MSTYPNPHARQWAQFKASTKDHELTTLHSDGLYRHYRMARPSGTSMWHWDVITWPGHLCVDGDIGDGLVFSRIPNMIDFFAMGLRFGRHDDGAPSFSTGYWAEKLSRGAKSVKTYSSEVFLRHVREALTDRDATPAETQEFMEAAEYVAEHEHDAREWLDNERRIFGEDTWEWEMTDWDHHFLLSCYAIAETVKRVTAL